MPQRRAVRVHEGCIIDLQLAGRSVIVTGASRGIGLAIAEAFAAEGAHLTICARGEDALRAAADRLADGGAKVLSGPEERRGEPIKLASLVDTEGNEFSLTQYVG